MRTLFSLFFAALAGLFLSTSAHASGARGTLVVVNQRDAAVMVIADGRALGQVGPRVDQAWRLSAGPHDVQIRGREGERIQESRFSLAAGAVVSVVVAPANGAVELYNGSGTGLRVLVDGDAASLSPGQSRTFTMKPGEHRIQALYTQLGRERLLADQKVLVSAGGRSTVRFAPVDEGLVRVENRTGRDATVLVDGAPQAQLQNGEATEVVTRLGRVSLVLSDRGRTLAQTSLAVGAYQDLRWSAAAPVIGELRILNPLPIPVLLDDGRGRAVTIAPKGQIVISGLPVGVNRVRATRTSGEVLGQANLIVDPYDTSVWSVPAPTTGLVTLSNRGGQALSVWIDGARTANLAPRTDAVVSLSLGSHRVQLRDTAGRLVLDTRVVVDPYNQGLVAWSTGSSTSHHGGREDRGNSRDHHHVRP